MNRDIPMVDLYGQFKEIEEEVLASIKNVIEKTAFINGPDVSEFSEELKEFTGAANVIPCGNGTDALQIALMGLDLKPGDKVIVPAFTYVATVEVIALLGLTPVFVDVDPNNFNIDTKKMGEALSEEVKAIIVVHLFGQCANMDQILSVAEEIPVIEDNAQALGAEYTFSNGEKKKSGTMGRIGTTSFFPTKNLGAYGDGGALFTDDDDLALYLKRIANHGQTKKYHHDFIGINSRLDTLQAAILTVKLRHLNEYASRRQKVAEEYDSNLKDIDGLEIPARNGSSTHVFHQYTLKIKGGKRNDLKLFLQERGVPSVVYYPIPQHMQKAYMGYGYKQGDFPVSEALCEEVLSLPVHTQMKRDDQAYIIQSVKEFFHG